MMVCPLSYIFICQTFRGSLGRRLLQLTVMQELRFEPWSGDAVEKGPEQEAEN